MILATRAVTLMNNPAAARLQRDNKENLLVEKNSKFWNCLL
jgi:hypothetical protein